jgi:hypothetical protein
MFGLVSMRFQQTGESGRKLGINDEAHRLSADENWVISFSGSIFQAGPDVVDFEVWVICKDLRLFHSSGEHSEDIFDPDAHSPNAGSTSTLVRIESDSVHDGGFYVPRSGAGKERR